jgi:hypothetical protein
MAGRTKPTFSNLQEVKPTTEEAKPTIAPAPTQSYNDSGKVAIRSRMGDMQIIVEGKITGRRYEWNASVRVVMFDKRDDVDALLTKRYPNGAPSCCGGAQFTDANYMFEKEGN